MATNEVILSMIDGRQFRYFLSIAKHEHLGHAADELDVSQPALSRSIIRLEEDYGTRLFDRTGRRMRLNDAGRLLRQHVERALAELEDARRALLARNEKSRHTVSIGFLATLGSRVIPGLIRRFKQSNPGVEFRLLQGPQPILQQMLVASEVDLCMSSPRFADSDLEWKQLYEEELHVLVPLGHSLSTESEIDLIEIAKEPIIALKPMYGLRQYMDGYARDAGFTPNVVFETEEVATLLGLVGAGFGVTLAPKPPPESQGLVAAIRVKSPRCVRVIGLSWRAGRYMPQRTIDFRNHIINVYRDGNHA